MRTFFMHSNYIKSLKRQFDYYKRLADQTFAQVNEKQFFLQPNEEENSLAILVNHMAGNMRSRWTNFYTEDGEKKWRNRDREFMNTFETKKEALAYWETGWDCLYDVINNLEVTDLERIVYIRNQGHTVVEAINRQLCHYSYHTGQIVFLGKLHLGAHWKSLSIPKNQSEQYNSIKFSKEKQRGHFTDDDTLST